MQGQLVNLLLLWAMCVGVLWYVTHKLDEIDKEEQRRNAKRAVQREREMAVVGQRVRRQLTIERFEGVKRKKQPIRKFCGELATFENQSILK